MPNATFFDFLRMGTRLPVELEGDVYSLCACNDAGARRLVEIMAEFRLADLDALAAFILDSSRRATLAEIARLPPGMHSAEIWSDGYEGPVRLAASMTIAADGIAVDFAGTSGLSGRGINVPAAYTRAYSAFGIKCVVAPDIPQQHGFLGAVPFHHSRGLHPERSAACRRRGAACGRAVAAGLDDGMLARGGAGPGDGGGVVVPFGTLRCAAAPASAGRRRRCGILR